MSYLFRKIHKNIVTLPVIKLYEAFGENDLEEVIYILRDIFSGISYETQIQHEKYYQTIFYLIFTLLGFYIDTEVKKNRGRIDAVVESRSNYIFEFKLNAIKEEALEQIKKKKYYEKYLHKGKSIYLVGVEFQERNIGEYVVEKV